jgi:GTPase SAR1 family protein
MKEIKEHAHPESIVVLVGAKLDLEQIRTVTASQGQDYLKSINGDMFMEISSKTGENVRNVTRLLNIVVLEAG